MADSKPVRKTVRKTTRKVARKPASASPISRVKNQQTGGGITLKFVALTVVALICGTAATFFLGFSDDGAIDVSERLSNRDNYVETDDFDNNERPIPTPAVRPSLNRATGAPAPEPAPVPEPEPESSATSTEETDESTEDETAVSEEAAVDSSEANADTTETAESETTEPEPTETPIE